MTSRIFAVTIAAWSLASPLLAAPSMTISAGGIQGGNWVWDVSLTPDLVLAGGSTPLAVELGFRLTGSQLLSVTNINPGEFYASNPGTIIFGWETTYVEGNGKPIGLEVNCTGCSAVNPTTLGGPSTTIVPGNANEIFAAIGSDIFTTPGPKPFLQIVAQGPDNGGGSSSTLEWLGAYGGKGRIAQATTGIPPSQNFDLYAGTATQVPEPASAALLALGVMAATCFSARRLRRQRPT
jgi:hypothetical protein